MTHSSRIRNRSRSLFRTLGGPALVVLAFASFAPTAVRAQEPAPAETEQQGELGFLEAYYQEHGREDRAKAAELYAEIADAYAGDADLVARALLGRYRCLRALSRDAEAEPVLRRLETEFSSRTDLIEAARAIGVSSARPLSEVVEVLVAGNRFAEIAEYGDVVVPHLARLLRSSRPSYVTHAMTGLIEVEPANFEALMLAAATDPEIQFPHIIAREADRMPRAAAEAFLEHPDLRARDRALLSVLGSLRFRRDKRKTVREEFEWINEHIARRPELRAATLGMLEQGAPQRWAAWAVNQADAKLRAEAIAAIRAHEGDVDDFIKVVFPTTEALRGDADAVALMAERVLTPKYRHGSIQEPELLAQLLGDEAYRDLALDWALQVAGYEWMKLDPAPLLEAYRARIAAGNADPKRADVFVHLFLAKSSRPTTSAEQIRLFEAIGGLRPEAALPLLHGTRQTTERTAEEWQNLVRLSLEIESRELLWEVLQQLPEALVPAALNRGLRDEANATHTAGWITQVMSNQQWRAPKDAGEEVDYRRLLDVVDAKMPRNGTRARYWLARQSDASRQVLAERLTIEDRELREVLTSVPPAKLGPFRPLIETLLRQPEYVHVHTGTILASRLGPTAVPMLEAAIRAQPKFTSVILRYAYGGHEELSGADMARLYRTALVACPPDTPYDANLINAVSLSMLDANERQDLTRLMLGSGTRLFVLTALALQKREPQLVLTDQVAALANGADPEYRDAAIKALEHLRTERERRRAINEDTLRGTLRARVDQLLAGEDHERMAGVAGLVALEGRAAALRLLEIATDDPSLPVREEARKALLALGSSN